MHTEAPNVEENEEPYTELRGPLREQKKQSFHTWDNDWHDQQVLSQDKQATQKSKQRKVLQPNLGDEDEKYCLERGSHDFHS